MGDKKDFDFDPDFKKDILAENVVILWRCWWAFTGHIMRLINKVNE